MPMVALAWFGCKTKVVAFQTCLAVAISLSAIWQTACTLFWPAMMPQHANENCPVHPLRALLYARRCPACPKAARRGLGSGVRCAGWHGSNLTKMKTEDIFKLCRKPTLPAQIGRATLFQIVDAADSVSQIRSVCQHTIGEQMHARFAPQMRFFSGSTLTLAQCRALFTLWHKWTWQEKEKPSAVCVEQFLHAMRSNFTLQ